MAFFIPTGSKSLDGLLGGGIPSGRVTEFAGASGTGKTQLLLSATVECVRNGGRVLFVETQGKMRPERLAQIAEARGLSYDVVLSSVDVLMARSADRMVAEVRSAFRGHAYRYLMVDSLSDLFYAGGDMSRSLSFLSLFCRDLAFEAVANGTVVAVSNGVRYNPKAGTTVPLGDEYIAPYIHGRVWLSRSGAELFALRPEIGAKAAFRIGLQGVKD